MSPPFKDMPAKVANFALKEGRHGLARQGDRPLPANSDPGSGIRDSQRLSCGRPPLTGGEAALGWGETGSPRVPVNPCPAHGSASFSLG